MNIGKHFRHSADPNCVVVPYREDGTHVTVFVLDDPKHDLNGKSLSIGGLVEVEIPHDEVPMIITSIEELKVAMTAKTGRIDIGRLSLVRDLRGWRVETPTWNVHPDTYARVQDGALVYEHIEGGRNGHLEWSCPFFNLAHFTHYFGPTGLVSETLASPPKVARAITSGGFGKFTLFYKGDRVIRREGEVWSMNDEARAYLLNRCTMVSTVM